MSDVTIYGVGASTYVRSAVMTCIEKGLDYDFQTVDFTSAEHRKRHPWNRMPAIRHGDVELFETSAICRYLDQVGGGDSLQPSDHVARARMDQWISVLDGYFYPDAIRGYVLQYIFPGDDGKPDRAAIDAALPKIKHDLEVLDAAYGKRSWLVGNSITLADIMVAPVMAYLPMFPEGKELLGSGFGNVNRAHAAIAERESFKTATALK